MQNRLIDVSYSQPTIDYQAVKESGAVDGVIIRCGRTLWGNFEPGADSLWERHYNGFKAVGIPVGAYYYGVAKNVVQAKQEADQCISLLNGKQLEYPIYYDVEELNTQDGLSKAQLTEVVKTFCKALEDAGFFAGFYTMLNWAQNKLDYPTLSKQLTSWVAWTGGDPATKLSPAPAAWQYSWNGRIPGISGNVDQNYFYQDFPSIIKSAGLNGFGKAGIPAQEPEKSSVTLEELRTLLKTQGITTIKL